jgi:hypothetical protein
MRLSDARRLRFIAPLGVDEPVNKNNLSTGEKGEYHAERHPLGGFS